MRRRLAAVAAIGALALTGACSDGPEVDVSAADGESSGGTTQEPSPAGEESQEPEGGSEDDTRSTTVAELGDPVATRKAGVHGHQLRVDVFPVERRGTLADLNFSVSLLKSEDGDDLQVADTFSDGNYDSVDATGFAVDGVRLLDGTNGKVHLAASDGQGSCLCTRDLSSTFIDPGDTIVMSATYAAPPEDVDAVSVQIPKFGTFTDVPVQ